MRKLESSRYGFALGGSSNGRTADSESVYRGSNPRPPASYNKALRQKGLRFDSPFSVYALLFETLRLLSRLGVLASRNTSLFLSGDFFKRQISCLRCCDNAEV
jgi:hypothetical protein